MPLATGTRLGSYEILSALGVGGMGEVYRARDTKLKREVAIKVLPEAFSQDPDRLARFEREAEVLATLNHPNIAAIYGIEESEGVQALVLELVEGPTLADRIAQGPMPVEEALPIAAQIALGLEAAHARGIIHRDLKPANIKVRPDGTVKILDFGLAKAFEKPVAGPLSESPTVLSPTPTLVGAILGTATYMSPEQARGKSVDTRTDVWAFGCVLFEMLTGTRAFDGETLTDVVTAIVRNEPDWRALPGGMPPAIRSLIARCLKKDPAQRLHHIADARFHIEDALADPAARPAAAAPARNRREWSGWIAAALLLGVGLFFAMRPSPAPVSGGPVSLPVFPPEKTAFSAAINTTVSVPSFALSPDGQSLVFAAESQGGRPMLWLRSLDRVTAAQLSGSEGAQDPFWSPDSRWIAFFADGKLKKMPIAGGAVQVVAQTAADFRGGTWGADDTILYASGTTPVLSVSAAGGSPAPVTVIDRARQEATHRNPHFLPDGRHFLYSVVGTRQDQSGVYVGSLDGKTKTLLLNVRSSAIYAHPGYVLFVDGNTLLAQAFDPTRRKLEGEPFFVVDQVGNNSARMSGISASRTGTLAYAGTLSQFGRLTWLNSAGAASGFPGTPEGDYIDFRLSPDDARLAASIADPKTNTIEVRLTDLTRSSTSRVATGGNLSASAIWSPDGSRLMFRSNANGLIEFYERSAAGGGNDRIVMNREAVAAARIPSLNLVLTDWSPDGRTVLFSTPAPATANDLWLLPLREGATPEKFLASRGEDLHGNFSPDGRLVAYTSDESGRFEVFIETLPRSDRRWPVSTNGGYEPRWRADGREIYYLSDDRKLMAVAVGPGPSFGIPRALFQTRVAAGVNGTRSHYVPSRDGRFLVNMAVDAPPSPITVVLNWLATVKR